MMGVIEFCLMEDEIHYQLSIDGVVTWIDLSYEDVSAIMNEEEGV